MSTMQGSSVVEDGSRLEALTRDLLFGEGPAWDPRRRCLVFSDIAGDTMYEWDADSGVKTFRAPSSMANGLAFDHDGRLIICEHATSRLTRIEDDGSLTVLASHFEGRELNSPNDVIVATDGSIWFTDPRGGREEFVGIPRPSELDFCGVFRIAPAGDLELVVDDFEVPNGLCFAPDDSCIYINDTTRGHIRRLEVDGAKVTSDVVFTDMPGSAYPSPGVPDGMKCLSDGRLLATGPHGVWVIDESGNRIDMIETPDTSTNLAFGDDDLRTLFITTLKGLYRVRLSVPGAPPVWVSQGIGGR